MFKRLAMYSVLISLFSVLTVSNSEAFFFKRNSAEKMRASEAKVEQKIIVVEIYAGWCPACRNIQPTLDLLQKDVSGIQFIQLDVSTPSKAADSKKQAEELSIADFYALNKSKTSTVGIIIPESKEIVSIFQNNNEIKDYKTAVQEAKTKQKALLN